MRNLHISKAALISVALLFTCFLTIKVSAQVTCNLKAGFQYTVVPNLHVNFKDASTDSSTSIGFTTTTLNLSAGSKAPTDIITGDFNQDGKLDLINTDSGSNNITEFLGRGDGTFAAAISFPTGGVGPVTIVSGDFNADNFPDLAIVNAASNNISVMLNNGNGTFASSVQYNTGTNPYKVVTADFNSDGILDLAVTNTGSNNISLFWGNGDGTFTTGAALADGSGTTPKSMTTADFNGDGKADLAVVNHGTNTFNIFLGNGSGGFSLSSGSPFPTDVYTSWSIVSGDFNGDGKPDLALADYSNLNTAVFLNKNDGTGNLAYGFKYNQSGIGARSIATGDLNGDGKLDLIVPITNVTILSILSGNGNGTFGGPSILNTGNGAYTPVTGDFNGDGRTDIALTNESSGNIYVYLNSLTPTTTSWHWDFGDGDTSNVQNPPHTYANDSAYNVCLTVTNSLACTNQYCSRITISPAAITDSAVATGPFCAGTNVPVPYIATGMFTAGNIFTAQLSDGNGSFALPVSIGSLTSTASGTITAAMPAGTIAGTGYRIRIVSSTPVVPGIDNGTNITINAQPPVSVTPASAVCTGQPTVTLTASGAVSYTWAPATNLSSTNGATETAQVSQLTIYTVTGSGANNCSASITVPVANVAAGGTISPAFSIICSGNAKTLTATGAAGSSYQWQMSTDTLGWNNINGATNTTYTTASSDGNSNKFYRLMAQSGGCGNTASNTAEVDVSAPVIAITQSNITNNSITLNWEPVGSGNYTVSYAGASSGDITGVTPSENITGLATNGTYDMTVTQTGVTGGCSADGAITVRLNKDSCGLIPYFGYSVDTIEHVSFHDLSTDSTGGSTVTSWLWNFGDGDSSTIQNPRHIYATGNTYNVCLTVTTSLGCTNQYCGAISVLKCSGGFVTAIRDTICTGATGSLSLTTNNNSIQWQSSIDDINFTDINGAASTTYKTVPLPQTTWYRAKVDSSTCFAFSDTLQLYVPAPLTAFFTATQTGTNELAFNSDSSVGAVRSYHWDFGDGQTSSYNNPVHQFSKDTTYHVCLTLYDASNCSYTYCQGIQSTLQTQQGGQISPAYSIICSGGTKTLVVTGATGGSYQWQISSDNSNWNNISGATNTTYTTAGTDGNIDEFYRLMTQNAASTTAEVDISAPVISVTASNITNQSVTLNWLPVGSGNYTLSYSGASSATLTSVTPPETITGLATNGTYNITITQTGVIGGCSASGTTVVNLNGDTCKLASAFWYSVDTVEHVSFEDLSTDSSGSGSTITSWLWNFGDGDSSTLPSPKHIYASGIRYNVCLTVNNTLGCTQTFCQQVNTTSPVGCRLTSNFSYTTDNTGTATFSDLSTDSTGNGLISAWNWNFGDGTGNSTLQNPTHQFTKGLHNVCLTVTDASGCTNQFCQQVEIDSSSINCLLTAQFSFDINDITGETFFTDLSTDSTAGASITSWHWDFGNGNTSDIQNSGLYYWGDSTFNVCLTVTNSLGCTQTICKQVVVNLIGCKLFANFSYTTDTTGLALFNDLSIDSNTHNVTAWNWNFGDPGSPTNYSYQQNASHIFTTSGTYNVCLTASDIDGCQNTDCKQVTISPTISSLCVSVYEQDTLSGSQTPDQETEFYLIKEINTAAGDSLALVDTFVYKGEDANYCFDAIPNGTYYAKAALTSTSPQYGSYFPTYFNAVLRWDDATPLNLNGAEYLSITLLKGSNPGGPGFIGGYVTQGANRLEQGASTNNFGDPIPGKMVLLTTGAGDPVAHTITDAQGHYQFTNLEYGLYNLFLDELNRPCTPLQVLIDDSSGYLEDANFQYNSKSITSGLALLAPSVEKYPFSVKLLGSPVTDELTLYLQNMSSDAVITITDVLGRKSIVSNAGRQTTLVKLNVQNLASGIYLVTVNSGSDVKTIKFVKE